MCLKLTSLSHRTKLEKIAQLSQRCRAILRVCHQYCCLASIVQYIERNLLLLVTSASDLPLRRIRFCSLLFVVVVHAAGCDKQRFSHAWRSVW